jgi:two-component system response regulator HupR/HoxA
MDEQMNQRPKILVVDDEQSSLNAINRVLRNDFEVLLSLNGFSALELLRQHTVDVILADQRMPEMSGVSLFEKAMEIQPDAARVMITGYTDIDAIIEAINRGKVFYYISKPWEPEELRLVIQRAAEQTALRRENQRLLEELSAANQRLLAENTLLQQAAKRQYHFGNIIGQSPAMKEVFRLMEKVIPTDTTVLILGETGTGKELIARAIHYNGPRKDRLFVAQNCGAMPHNLLESELFGHVKGAFTGATSDKKGLFEIADGGTIFLDEISDTSPAMQQRLLRVLQEGEIHPVGSEKTIKVNVRVISAANRDLQEAIEAGTFRKDLYYRLNVFPIRIPPLRERREDIPLLANHFLVKYGKKIGKENLRISEAAMAKLLSEDYPGNVRQLENMIERAVTLVDDHGVITPELLSSQININPIAIGNSSDQPTLKDVTENIEAYMIREALKANHGNITKTAEALGLSRLGLHKKMQRYHIDSTFFKPVSE